MMTASRVLGSAAIVAGFLAGAGAAAAAASPWLVDGRSAFVLPHRASGPSSSFSHRVCRKGAVGVGGVLCHNRPTVAKALWTGSGSRATGTRLHFFWDKQQEEEEEPAAAVEESEEEREVRRLEAVLSRRLELSGEAMRADAPAYVALLGLQALPVAMGGAAGANFLYFWCTAVLSVYLGAKRAAAVAKAGKIFQTLDVRNAVAAPFAASVSLFGTYWLLQNLQLDIATIYQLLTTSFGWFCLREVLASAVLAVRPETPVPSGKVVGGLAAALVAGLYLWASPAFHLLPPHDMAASPWLLPLSANVITAGIALQAQGTLNLKSIKPALLFLLGLFCYDVYFVFLAPGGVMESVATSVEGPVKFLSPRLASAAAASPNAYPYSILGLGDVVIPGLFVGLLRKFEEQQQEEAAAEGSSPPPRTGLFGAGVAGYGAGLLLTFLANTISRRGQPALLYINPVMAGAALVAALALGQWEDLWAFKSQEDDEDEEEGAAPTL